MLKTILLQKDGEVLHNEKGFTIAEALVTATIVVIIASIIAQTTSSASRYYKRLMDKRGQERQLVNMINRMKADVDQFEIGFDPDEKIEEVYPTKNDFPYYWNSRYDYVTANECISEIYKNTISECPLEGRMAYLIQPVKNMPGLFKVTIKSFHSSLALKDDDFKTVTVFIKSH